MSKWGLEGKVTLITGASSGIGRATACALADAGCAVVAVARDATGVLEALAVDLSHRSGQPCLAVPADVTASAAMSALFRRVQAEYGRLDIFVNNAGRLGDARIGMMADAFLDEVLDVNLKSAIRNLQLAARLMQRHHAGAIVNIGSIMGLRGSPGQVAYSAAKAGIVGMTRSAARELAPTGVRVNAVAPGFIDTPMTRALTEDVRQERLGEIPMQRAGTPQEVAQLITFLASPLAAYITGQIVGIDGGIGA